MKRIRLISILCLIFLIMGAFFINTNNKKGTVIDIIEIGNPKKLSSYIDVHENDKDVSGTDNIKFDAFFVINGAQKRGNSIAVGDNKKLRIILSVEGDTVLEEAEIKFNNTNVIVGYTGTFNNSFYNSRNVEKMFVHSPIESGRNSDFFVELREKLSNDVTSYSGTNSIVLEGRITDNGVSKRIRKEVEYVVDWYLKDPPVASINENYTINAKNKNGNLEIDYNFGTNLDMDSLLKSVNLDIDIPKLNDAAPISAKIIGTNFTYEADLTNYKLTGKREAVISDGTIVNSAADYTKDGYSYNNYKVVLEYPTVYEDNISIPPLNVNAWYEVYNNPDSDYQNIISSNIANKILIRAINVTHDEYDIASGYIYPSYVNFVTSTTVGSVVSGEGYINKTDALNIFDDLVANDITTYAVTWNTLAKATCSGPIERCSPGKVNLDSLIINEPEYDRFNNNTSMKDVIRYKSISFTNTWMLGDSGYIKLINADTNETIHVFTKADWMNEYIFEGDVKKIRIETSSIRNIFLNVEENTSALTAYIVKEIDNNQIKETYTKTNFENFNTINSKTKTSGVSVGDTTYIYADNQGAARYVSYSSSKPTLGLSTYSLKTNEDANITFTINTGTFEELVKGFKDGEFLITIPKQIVNTKINEVTTNKDTVEIVAYELIENDDNTILRIFTANEYETDFLVNIDALLTPDSRSLGEEISFELYAINNNIKVTSNTARDIYDVDKDGDVTEYVGYHRAGATLVVPTDVITNTTIKTYAGDNTERSIVSPRVTDVNPLEDSENGRVEVMVMNNSSEPLQDIIVMGKVGFTGNTYQISGADLGSQYNIPMTSDGITIPDEVSSIARVYYSENPNPTNDVNGSTNHWKTKEEVNNFNNIKSYMIILDGYSMDQTSLVFTYDIKLPLDKSLINKTSYFTHGVYYNAVTLDGLVYRELGGAKAGIQMAIKYKMDLRDYKAFSDRLIPNAKYVLTDENGKSRILIINSTGYVHTEDLYVDIDYQLKQNDVMFPYMIDEETKYFTIISDANDILRLSGSEVGSFRNISITNDLLDIELENEVRYDLVIRSTDIDSLSGLPGSSFKITGRGMETGKEIITNTNGELKLHGLYLDYEYVIEQTYAHDSLGLTEPFTIILKRDQGVLKMYYKDGNNLRGYSGVVDVPHIKNSNIIQNILDDDTRVAPIYHIEIKTKAIPIYKLEVTKVSADTHELLKDAQYKLTGYGLPNLGAYIKTDANGKATIDLKEEVSVSANNSNTYNVTTIDGFDYSILNGEYTIQEIVPPVGYTIDNKIIKFKINKIFDSSNCVGNNTTHAFECTTDNTTQYTQNLIYSDPNVQFVESTYDMDTNTLRVVLYDYPLVNITKKDGEDNSLLPNTLFSIYSLSYDDDGEEILEPAQDANGNTIGSEITINGQKQYVIPTNANGKLNLSLSSGEYKAVEIQASHDKYRLDNRGYYFSVGPTVEYEGGGVVLQDSFNANGFALQGLGIIQKVISTSDGGWLLSRCSSGISCGTNNLMFEKYDKNHNIQWTMHAPTRLYTSVQVYKYYDDKTKEIRIPYGSPSSYYPPNDGRLLQDIFELEDGYVLFFESGGVFKVDKEGHFVWRDHDSNALNITYYTAACDKDTGKFVEVPNLEDQTGEILYDMDNPYIQRDENTYYCSTRTIYDDITGYYQPELIRKQANSVTQSRAAAVDSKGNVTVLSGGWIQSSTFILADGTLRSFEQDGAVENKDNYCSRRVYDDPDDPNSAYHLETRDEWCSPSYYDNHDRLQANNYTGAAIYPNRIERYDSNGNLVAANLLNAYLYKAGVYTGVWGYNYPIFHVYTLENDDLLIFSNSGLARLRYNEEYHDYDVIGGTRHPGSYYNQSADILLKPEGNGYNTMQYRNGILYNYNENLQITSTIDIKPQFNIEVSGENYIQNVINSPTTGSNVTYYKINNDRYLFFVTDIERDLDNTIISVYTKSGDTVNVEVGKEANGNLVNRLIIFETDGESNIKWIRQYKGFEVNKTANWNWTAIFPQLSPNKRKLLFPMNALPNSTLYSIDTGKSIVLNGNMLIMEVLDETAPEVPEKYSVDVLNYRKTYDITIDSRENGVTEVVNGDNTLFAINNDSQIVDSIKYGDDYPYVIKAKGNADYLVDQVFINGEEHGYTLLDDGSVILDPITNIKENKTIVITYKFADSYVVVHHYKKGTNERIASDETISGPINSPYETNPVLHELYQLQTDENGNFILPTNKDGFFASTPSIVIYYYEEGLVNLKVNYYLKNTTISLVPSIEEIKTLGTHYKTAPVIIDTYELVDIIGDEEGTLDKENTVVTYMYQERERINIVVKYVNKDTNEEIIPSTTTSVYRLDSYEIDLKEIEGYTLVDKTSNYKGIAEDDAIEVIIYYSEIIPEQEEVKGEEEVKESPQTGDNIIIVLFIGVISIIGLLFTIGYKTNKE